MSRLAGWNWLLESARRITSPGEIQVAKRNTNRPPQPAEAMALTISALGALDRHTGVHTLNLTLDGKPHAIAIIEGATFEERKDVTALVQVNHEKKS